jgi:hypothetical protein
LKPTGGVYPDPKVKLTVLADPGDEVTTGALPHAKADVVVMVAVYVLEQATKPVVLSV